MAIRLFLASMISVAGLAAAQAQEASCSNAGNVYQVGDVACIAACHGRQRLAKCELVSNAATWTTLSESCPSARLMSVPDRGQSSRI